MSKNMALFDDFAVQIMADLYAAFPQRQAVDCIKLSGAGELDEYGRASHECDICAETVRWLHEEGYVRAESLSVYGANQVTLTSKGLELLRAVPSSLRSKASVGDQLVAMLKGGARESARALLNKAMAEGLARLGGQ